MGKVYIYTHLCLPSFSPPPFHFEIELVPCSLGWPQTLYVAQVGLKLLGLLYLHLTITGITLMHHYPVVYIYNCFLLFFFNY